MSDNILEKVISTTTVGAGGSGILNPEQTDRFIDYMWDATVLGQECDKRRMKSTEEIIDKVAVGTRLVRVAVEATDTGENATANFTKVSITTVKLRLDWELSTESLEDNIEGEQLEDHIARLMATQFGNDLEDIAINGDTASSDLALKAFDGWYKRAKAAGHVIDNGGNALDLSVFNKALKAMPRNFMQRRSDLRFYTGSNAIQDYLYSFVQQGATPYPGPRSDRGNLVRTEGGAGWVADRPFGVDLKEVPLFTETDTGTYSGASGQHGHVELTFPDNRLWGIKREIKVYREFKPKKDAIEYVTYVRSGVQIAEANAYVVVTNIKVA